nr:reverse transcriptase domain-containing protein [Bradyrhizobium sp. WSM1743]
MARAFPALRWCRYADDGLVHCRNEMEAQSVREALQARLAECRLELHPTKTRIVYCKDDRRRDKSETVMLTFSVIASGHDRSWDRIRRRCSVGSPQRSANQR